MKILQDPKTGRFLKGTQPPQTGQGKPLEGNTECSICHKIFHWKRSFYNKPPKTCSKECRYKSASLTGTHHLFKKCAICGKVFSLPPSLMKDARRKNERFYCSRECRWKTRMRWSENEKDSARYLIRNLVKRGILEKKRCHYCGKKETEAHHYLGYDRSHWLDVLWLCDEHHVQEHERLRKEGKLDLV